MAATCNGIVLDDLKKTIDTLKKTPEIGRFRFKTTNRWIDGTHTQATVKDFYGAGADHRRSPMIFEEDEPPVLLGKNAGANPMEYVLVALSGCLTTGLIAQATARGVKLDAVESELEGDLDVRGFLGISDEVRKGYESIRIQFRIQSDAPEETIRELVDLAQTHSPVLDIITNKVPVTIGYEQSDTSC